MSISEIDCIWGYLSCSARQQQYSADRKADHLERFEPNVRHFVEAKQNAARKYLPVFASQTWLGIWFRNLAMRTMNFRPLAELLLTRSVRDDFELPDYPTMST
jgi:2-polyprenyl-6-methoxyphenol hydroxylase-like FAD-dependent oxidoreductase